MCCVPPSNGSADGGGDCCCVAGDGMPGASSGSGSYRVRFVAFQNTSAEEYLIYRRNRHVCSAGRILSDGIKYVSLLPLVACESFFCFAVAGENRPSMCVWAMNCLLAELAKDGKIRAVYLLM